MAKGDLEIVGFQSYTPVRTFRVEERNTSGEAQIKAGEPVRLSSTTSNHVIICNNGDPEVGSTRFVGIAASDSTESATLEGTVEVFVPVPGLTVIRGKANDSTAIDTTDERVGILNDAVTFDRSSADVFTIDENETDDAGHGLVVVDADIDKGTVDVVVKSAAIYSNRFGNATVD